MSDEHTGRLFTATNASVIAIHEQLDHLATVRLGAPSFDRGHTTGVVAASREP
jgi:hypothetical protein